MAQDPLVEGNVGFDPPHLILPQRPTHAEDRFHPVLSPGNQLRDHRIIVNRHLRFLIDTAIIADPESLRQPQPFDLAGKGHEIVFGILGVDPTFDGVPGLRDVTLAPRQITSRCYFDLRLHQIDSYHSFGNRVLYLKPRIHLQKVKGLLLIQQKLQGAGAHVTDGSCALDRDTPDAPPSAIVQTRRRRLFNNFLMAPLD